MFSSSEIIASVLSAIGIEENASSVYITYSYEDGRHLRLRLSWHGLFLQNYFNKNKELRKADPNEPKLNKGQNLAITFAPNEDECKAEGIPFPYKIKNVTKAKTAFGNNVKPQFSVRHICYENWQLTENEVQSITAAVVNCVRTGDTFVDPLGSISGKVIEWIDTSNLPPKKKQN